MKRPIIVLGFLGTIALLGSSSVSAEDAGGPCICHKAVRVDYIDLAGNHAHSNTFCEIVNTSRSTPITLLNVYVLGSGGIGDVRATYTGLSGQVVPPLGRARFDVNNTVMPGLVAQTAVGNHGVANVVVGWSGGTMDSVVLTSNIVRTDNPPDRTEVYYVGSDITL